MPNSQYNVLIIGAGIAGLSAARRLALAGVSSVLLDKGRGIGGRMATRRSGEAVFDHGAQYFSAKTPEFQEFVKQAATAGALREWRPNLPDKVHPRWIGADGMNVVPKFLGKKQHVLTGKKALRMEPVESGWAVITEDGGRYMGNALLVTIPAPQALELLANSNILLPESDLEALRQIAYYPCLAVLATLDRVSNIPAPGGLLPGGDVLSWMADNYQKGISKSPSAVLHASPAFSLAHLEGDLQVAGNQMLEAAARWIAPDSIVEWQIHRWRYSLAHRRHPAPFLAAAAPHPLRFGGDGFGIGNVEGAFLSGLAMAADVINQLGTHIRA